MKRASVCLGTLIARRLSAARSVLEAVSSLHALPRQYANTASDIVQRVKRTRGNAAADGLMPTACLPTRVWRTTVDGPGQGTSFRFFNR